MIKEKIITKKAKSLLKMFNCHTQRSLYCAQRELQYSACDVIRVIPTLHISRYGNVSQSVNQIVSRLKYLYIYWED